MFIKSKSKSNCNCLIYLEIYFILYKLDIKNQITLLIVQAKYFYPSILKFVCLETYRYNI